MKIREIRCAGLRGATPEGGAGSMMRVDWPSLAGQGTAE